MELDHHGLLRLEVNHERAVNKLKYLLWIDFFYTKFMCGLLIVAYVWMITGWIFEIL